MVPLVNFEKFPGLKLLFAEKKTFPVDVSCVLYVGAVVGGEPCSTERTVQRLGVVFRFLGGSFEAV